MLESSKVHLPVDWSFSSIVLFPWKTEWQSIWKKLLNKGKYFKIHPASFWLPPGCMDEHILTNDILHYSGLFFFNLWGYISFHNQSFELVIINILYFYTVYTCLFSTCHLTAFALLKILLKCWRIVVLVWFLFYFHEYNTSE